MKRVLLRIEALACERDGRTLFAGLSLALPAGEALELRGPNGSGKSTLLRAVAGLYPDVRGTLEAADSLYLGHRAGLSARLTAAENLTWYRALAGTAGAATLPVAEALCRVGMAGYEDALCQQLSAGQQRRVGLARLLVCHAPLWLLDEPLTALDQSGAALVRALVAEHLGAGGAALCATHQALGLDGARQLTLENVDAAALPDDDPASREAS